MFIHISILQDAREEEKIRYLQIKSKACRMGEKYLTQLITQVIHAPFR